MRSKILLLLLAVLWLPVAPKAQAPAKFSYQAVVRNAAGKLIQGAPVGIRFSILHSSATGAIIYTETQTLSTNVNGLITAEVGTGNTFGNLSGINWADGPYFLQTEIDPAGGTNYTIAGTTQLISVPYAMNAATVGPNGFSGSYEQLTNKPLIDGSETKVVAGARTTVTGTGTTGDPYVVNSSANSGGVTTILTTSQTWTVPPDVSKIKVELWGGAGGGGGAGAYSYSYYFINGGSGGSGGYSRQTLNVQPGQNYVVTIGEGGPAGTNAVNWGGWFGDTDGGNGGDTWFGPFRASGGTGGKRGSFSTNTVNGNPGTLNTGEITGYASKPASNLLDTFIGLVRSYLTERIYSSRPGAGGSLSGYSSAQPSPGEGGAAVITFIE